MTVAKKAKRPKPPPRALWIIWARDGTLLGSYPTLQEAQADAWGPIFRGCRFVPYQRHGPIQRQEGLRAARTVERYAPSGETRRRDDTVSTAQKES